MAAVRTICVQVQPKQSPGLDMAAVARLMLQIAISLDTPRFAAAIDIVRASHFDADATRHWRPHHAASTREGQHFAAGRSFEEVRHEDLV
jgi:hypothetical protein